MVLAECKVPRSLKPCRTTLSTNLTSQVGDQRSHFNTSHHGWYSQMPPSGTTGWSTLTFHSSFLAQAPHCLLCLQVSSGRKLGLGNQTSSEFIVDCGMGQEPWNNSHKAMPDTQAPQKTLCPLPQGLDTQLTQEIVVNFFDSLKTGRGKVALL